MWSRVIEVMLGCWMLISPFLFRHASGETGLWINDLTCGSLVILFGLFSYWQPTRHAHLLSMIVAGWLIAFAYLHGFGDAPAASQNHLILGLLLLMFAVIPNDTSQPSTEWEKELSKTG